MIPAFLGLLDSGRIGFVRTSAGLSSCILAETADCKSQELVVLLRRASVLLRRPDGPALKFLNEI